MSNNETYTFFNLTSAKFKIQGFTNFLNFLECTALRYFLCMLRRYKVIYMYVYIGLIGLFSLVVNKNFNEAANWTVIPIRKQIFSAWCTFSLAYVVLGTLLDLII